MSLAPAAAVDAVTGPPAKPRLRGMLHLVAFPVSLALGGVLVAIADDEAERWGCVVFAVASAVLFGVSALYHRGTWDARRLACCAGWTTRTSS